MADAPSPVTIAMNIDFGPRLSVPKSDRLTPERIKKEMSDAETAPKMGAFCSALSLI